ncbi:catechol 2,3-dioxygenase-like lactoylglutathione lyase family enzyme [Bradyrhizobium sp. LB7.1]
MKFSVEVITIPVSDVDRALQFYVDKVGFALDVDYSPSGAFRVVQLTPSGSSCSIQIGKGITEALAGSLRNAYLVVTDLEATRRHLLERGRSGQRYQAQDADRRVERQLRAGTRSYSRGLRQLRRLFGPGRQRLGAPGTGLPHCLKRLPPDIVMPYGAIAPAQETLTR